MTVGLRCARCELCYQRRCSRTILTRKYEQKTVLRFRCEVAVFTIPRLVQTRPWNKELYMGARRYGIFLLVCNSTVWTSVSCTDFLVFYWPHSEKILPFIHQHDRVVRKTSDVSAADWRYQTREKISYFFKCVVTAFLRAGIPCRTP